MTTSWKDIAVPGGPVSKVMVSQVIHGPSIPPHRASWLVEVLGEHTDKEFQVVMRRFFDRWVEEFQQVEQSLGGNA
ncbi:hypothetical protein [Paraburkholderia oxyphila]|uniref:hypothetical protein n=1 Tax=Paraburkholderia oxyphila TaxID=614212 RepID=UPI0004828597|nr:hypothetical protein [Paraburkholderia oxyphila]